VLFHLATIAAAGAAVWWAGTQLSRDADRLAAATGWGRVLVGALLLGVATSLPEIATTVTAGVIGNPQLAIGNLMGGVAVQVVVLAVADIVESDQRLMFQVTRPTVLFQHVALLVLLAVAGAGMVVGEPVSVLGMGVWPAVLAVGFAGSVALVKRFEGHAGWRITGADPPLNHEDHDDRVAERDRPDRPPLWRLAALGAVILAAGWAVARSGDALADSDLLSGTFIGAGLVAVTTSLPEMSTVIGSLRVGSYDMAVANIMGTNGLEVALLLVADAAYRDGPILDAATTGDAFLASLAAVLTGIYLGGLLLRGERTVLRVGYDSAAVIITYVVGLGILAVL
jgi:cation:H+ antiporter